MSQRNCIRYDSQRIVHGQENSHYRPFQSNVRYLLTCVFPRLEPLVRIYLEFLLVTWLVEMITFFLVWTHPNHKAIYCILQPRILEVVHLDLAIPGARYVEFTCWCVYNSVFANFVQNNGCHPTAKNKFTMSTNRRLLETRSVTIWGGHFFWGTIILT